MPTGYTSEIRKGISFPKFAMDCARAFGACIDLRDDPTGGECIPERFEPSAHSAKALETYKDQLSKLKRITLFEADDLAEEDYQKEEARRISRLKELRELRASYSSMLAKVLLWEPPTPDHVELKKFMIQQIEESIRFDCCEEYYAEETEKEDGVQWLTRRLNLLKDKIAYHATKQKEEIDRTEKRNQWISALRNSLK